MLKTLVRSKFMCITFAGFFIAFSYFTYNYNLFEREKVLKLGRKSNTKPADVSRDANLLLIKTTGAMKTLRRPQGNSEDKNSSTESSANFADDKNWDTIQKISKLRLQNECRKLQNGTIKIFSMNDLLSSQRFRLQNFLVDDHHKAIYCYIPKVACTQWKRIMMVLTGQYHTDNPESINTITAHYKSGLMTLSSNEFKQEDVTDRLLNYRKFLIVRHPLERLLSAFRDKFQGTGIDAKVFQKFYATNMMKFTRNQTTVGADGSGMKFQEFLYYLANHDPVYYQEHWMPFFYLCHPCAINYDFIGKFENLEADSNNILRRLEGSANISFPPMKLSNTKNILEQMVNEIPISLLEKIREVYNLDFRLFGYS